MTPKAAAGLRSIIAAALAGQRCPTNETMENPNGTIWQGATTELARAGHIKIEIYAKNYRVVTILKGPHAGLSTKPYPDRRAKPYKTITTQTVRTYAPTHPLGRPEKIAP